MITSALGTSPIMRRMAICICNWRIRPLTSGLPSLSLNSSLISCLVILSWRLWFQLWNGTSMATMGIRAQQRMISIQSSRSRASTMPPGKPSRERFSRWLNWLDSIHQANRLINTTFAMDLTSSTRDCTPNILLMPLRGLSLLHLGSMASEEKFIPPSRVLPTKAAMITSMNSSPRGWISSPSRAGTMAPMALGSNA